MPKSILKQAASAFLWIVFVVPTVAQDTIPPKKKVDSIVIPTIPPKRKVDSVIIDTMAIDTMIVDTLVIRRKQERIKNFQKDIVTLNTTVISLKKTQPTDITYSRSQIPSFWQKINLVGLNFSEAAFVNWNAGGTNSISALANARFERNYKFRNIQWENILEMRYGINLQDNQRLRKSDDAIRISSTFGYRRDTISNWYYSAKANFNSQFSDGFKYPDRDTPISRPLSPGYFFLGAGASYISKERRFNLYISPITQKATLVLDQDLADRGAFGVQKAVLDADGNVLQEGENVFLELGFLITNSWESQLYKNMGVKHRLNLYTDYLRSFGNIDIDWELNVELRVNEFIVTQIGTHLIYDDDILFNEVKNEEGIVIDPGEPRLQFKQLLGVGVSYNF
ncbi:DUF3078 domain-containing protein [Flavobacteriaceae bacterium TP-CH-4]|uniref:DUF3078 domain-containing protein n=1 Tax=Pelagihabitans pacificus TaxID=2696054 RepID=A0A967AUV1_9FLAO|nr:DUF3078 domain-containing protein [Pelagihabitans pacificus]NHF60414.1 DUF3078 domain-containing protein [Pelagihabitans pacificus]